MPRDTYNDYVAYEEAYDCGSAEEASALCGSRLNGLLSRSGARNVANSKWWAQHSLSTDALLMGVSFDSRAWTGR